MARLRGQIGGAIANYLKDYASRLQYARLDEKLIRDPIFGFLRLRPYEALIVDSPLFQRLRGIFQTALTFLTYPSSIHTRFEHSLNCLQLASRVLRALKEKGTSVDAVEDAEVRLAALLHDIGHCIFSHGSEFFYQDFPQFVDVLEDEEVKHGSPSESECVNYAILTSKEFKDLLWEPVKKRCFDDKDCRKAYDFLDKVDLKRIAQMIIGMSPENVPAKRYMTDIINGPLDVDKLDYLTRDGYFTGVNLAVDIDRLLPSLDTAKIEPVEKNKEAERKLVVDHRGIAVVEQLLFARMMLYDTVYHHHKVRAAQAALKSLLTRYHQEAIWSTTSKKLDSMGDFLEIDEYDFFGWGYTSKGLTEAIKRLRYRNLPERALVITPRALTDDLAHSKWSTRSADSTNREDEAAQNKAKKFEQKIIQKVVTYVNEVADRTVDESDIFVDFPEPPGQKKLGEDTYIKIHTDCVERLRRLFPFQKVVNNYSKQYKYRTYVFAPESVRSEAAYAAFRAFFEEGITLNDLGLILAHQETGRARELLMKYSIPIPDWRKKFYMPDLDEE
ncbi:MAG TPA: HD domain-containing protein [Chthoniobacterales bacterium]|nr:HD domain-containing protein [Chthoniobacterales bacterium]